MVIFLVGSKFFLSFAALGLWCSGKDPYSFVIQYVLILRLVHSLWAPDLMHWIPIFLNSSIPHILILLLHPYTLWGNVREYKCELGKKKY